MTEIKLYGPITHDLATEAKEALAAAEGDVTVRIDSPGGSVHAGFSLFSAAKEYAGKTTAVIESAAFSIASYIAMAFDDVEIVPNGYLMIHNPRMNSGGDDDEHRKNADYLAKLKADMVAAYAMRTGMPADKIRDLLKKETFFDAAEAVQSGLADRVTSEATASRIESFEFELPPVVAASLRSVDGNGGLTPKPKGKEPMAEDQTPKAATITEIKQAYPTASSDFVLQCVEKGMPMAEVSEAQNTELQARNAILEKELADLKASTESAVDEAVKQAEAEAKATLEAAKAEWEASGHSPIPTGEGSSKATATAKWSEAVKSNLSTGMTHLAAAQAANREFPGLREEMLKEAQG